jgi:hypothetical protein
VRSRVSSSVSFDPRRALIPPQPATKPTLPMKKPAVGETDKLRALTEDPELRALMERYYAVPPTRREQILKTFAEKADELHPDWRETMERSRRDGVILRALFIHTLKGARAQTGLTRRKRAGIRELEARFITLYDIFSLASPVSVAAEDALELASVVQEMALMASLGFEEVERLKLYAEVGRRVVKGGQKGGKESGKTRRKENRPWVPHATELAKVICAKHPDYSNEKVALEIVSLWRLEEPSPPGARTLATFVSELRKAKKLPKRAK